MSMDRFYSLLVGILCISAETTATADGAFDYGEGELTDRLSIVLRGDRTKRTIEAANSDLNDVINYPWADVDNVTGVANMALTRCNDSRTELTTAYYNVTIHQANRETADSYWTDVEHLLEACGCVVGSSRNTHLQNAYRKSVVIPLQFDFPFYGNPVRDVAIASGGFCYVGAIQHSWLAATQYIAPLMANFHTQSPDARILYADTGSSFVVEWRNVRLRQQEQAGPFTFQVALHENGTIWFVYKQIPLRVDEVDSDNHPVKVGLSDATVTEPDSNSKRVIYEYDRIEVNMTSVANNVVIELVPNAGSMTV